VIQLGPVSSDAMFEVVEISDACFVHILLLDVPHDVVTLGEFGDNNSGEMNCDISLSMNYSVARAQCTGALSSRENCTLMILNLRHYYVVLYKSHGTFYNVFS